MKNKTFILLFWVYILRCGSDMYGFIVDYFHISYYNSEYVYSQINNISFGLSALMIVFFFKHLHYKQKACNGCNHSVYDFMCNQILVQQKAQHF